MSQKSAELLYMACHFLSKNQFNTSFAFSSYVDPQICSLLRIF
jgi:hypothetical protein